MQRTIQIIGFRADPPLHPKVPKWACVSHLFIEGGGGVALIWTPQLLQQQRYRKTTDRKGVGVSADRERKYWRLGHNTRAQVLHPTRGLTAVRLFLSKATENVKKMVIKKSFFPPGAKWRSTATTQNKQWHLNGRPEDPAPLFLPQPWAWLMSCVLTSPSCRIGPASQVCPVIPPPQWVWELVSHSDAHSIAALISTFEGYKHKLTIWTEVWQSYSRVNFDF